MAGDTFSDERTKQLRFESFVQRIAQDLDIPRWRVDVTVDRGRDMVSVDVGWDVALRTLDQLRNAAIEELLAHAGDIRLRAEDGAYSDESAYITVDIYLGVADV